MPSCHPGDEKEGGRNLLLHSKRDPTSQTSGEIGFGEERNVLRRSPPRLEGRKWGGEKKREDSPALLSISPTKRGSAIGFKDLKKEKGTSHNRKGLHENQPYAALFPS